MNGSSAVAIEKISLKISLCRCDLYFLRFRHPADVIDVSYYTEMAFKRLFMLSNFVLLIGPNGNSLTDTWSAKLKTARSSHKYLLIYFLLSIKKAHLASGYCLLWFQLRQMHAKLKMLSGENEIKETFDDWKWLLAPKRESAGRKFIVEFIKTKF